MDDRDRRRGGERKDENRQQELEADQIKPLWADDETGEFDKQSVLEPEHPEPDWEDK